MVLLARQLCFASRDVAGDVLRDRHNTWVRTYMAGSDFLASARLSQCLQFCVRCGSSWELHFAVTGAILSHRVVLAVAGAILWTCWVALSWQADAWGVGFGRRNSSFEVLTSVLRGRRRIWWGWTVQAQDLRRRSLGEDCWTEGHIPSQPNRIASHHEKTHQLTSHRITAQHRTT